MGAIDPLTAIPLQLTCVCRGATGGSTGTGFVVHHKGMHYLITNWHVVSGRHPETDQPIDNVTGLADPDLIHIWHHDVSQLGRWLLKAEQLRDPSTGVPRWLEHPSGRAVDVVALALPDYPDVKFYVLDLTLASTDVAISPSEPVSIIGFPFGLSVDGKFPIWKTGHVASDLDLNFSGKPAFLIDATTTSGMSGSPVMARRIGAYRSSQAALNVGGEANRLLGVYSGRIRAESDLGIVWKPDVLDAILP